MADGAASITKVKENVWKAFEENTRILEDGSKIDQERGMCYPHVQRNCQAKLKTVPEYEKEILEDIRAVQLSEKGRISRVKYDVLCEVAVSWN